MSKSIHMELRGHSHIFACKHTYMYMYIVWSTHTHIHYVHVQYVWSTHTHIHYVHVQCMVNPHTHTLCTCTMYGQPTHTYIMYMYNVWSTHTHIHYVHVQCMVNPHTHTLCTCTCMYTWSSAPLHCGCRGASVKRIPQQSLHSTDCNNKDLPSSCTQGQDHTPCTAGCDSHRLNSTPGYSL